MDKEGKIIGPMNGDNRYIIRYENTAVEKTEIVGHCRPPGNTTKTEAFERGEEIEKTGSMEERRKTKGREWRE